MTTTTKHPDLPTPAGAVEATTGTTNRSQRTTAHPGSLSAQLGRFRPLDLYD
jgi:hypothetical protein